MHARGEHLGRRRATCSSVAALLPAVADGDARLEGAAEAHVAACLRCQADLARYRRLRRTLRALGQPAGDPGPDLLPAILAALDQAGLPRSARVIARWAVAAGVVGTTAVAAVLVVLVRHRRPLAG